MGRNRGKPVEDNDSKIKELKAANRRLKSDNERLKAELTTMHEAFSTTSTYLKGNTDNISVEKIIEGVKKGFTLAEIKKEHKCGKCGSNDIKELKVQNVGRLILCSGCKSREVIRDGKDNEH